MISPVEPHLAGPWPDGTMLVRAELASYLDDVAGGALDALPTRCDPWTVRDVTVHLAETFRRFERTLDQGRAGDFTAPFTPDELDAENLRAVAAFSGDPVDALTAAVDGFLDRVEDLDEPMPHQLSTVPVGLVVLFGLLDITMHHDDVLAAAGRRYQPPPDTIAAVVVVAERLFGMPADLPDPWLLMVAGSGRPAI